MDEIPRIPICFPGTRKMTRMYQKWKSMKARCYSPSHPAFAWYGAKGIKVCDRWLNNYSAFHLDMGEAPPGAWLDRIDGTKDYGPGNCRWVTPKESASNRKPRGPTPGSLKNYCRERGVDYHRVIHRLRAGWTITEAVNKPVRKSLRQKILDGTANYDDPGFPSVTR